MKKVIDQGVLSMKKDIEFIDENERFSQKIDYSQELMNQIDKVRLSGSVEFRGGYWENREKMIGGSLITEKIYIPDTRQVYIGSVDQLYDLLIPFLDKKFIEANKEIEKKIKDLNEEKEKKKEDLTESEFNVWYYSELRIIKRWQYRQLIFLMSRMGMFGIKKTQEVY